MANDCGICCNTFNLKGRKEVKCGYCDYRACGSCIQTYFLNTTTDPHCMNCKKGWNQEFLDCNLTKSFMTKEFKKHRENILFEKEKCLMPGTQEEVIRLKNLKLLKIEKDRLYKEITKSNNTTDVYELKVLVNEVEYAIIELVRNRLVERREFEEYKYVRKCPVDSCKGFLSRDWNCGVCENRICEKCNEIDNGTDHVCNPDNVATTELLNKDSKPCPGCGQVIFKISGCAQMWCPGCHTTFDWYKMQIEHGSIHNPHYYEFRKNNLTRELGDIPCGGRPDISEIARVFGRERLYSPQMHMEMNLFIQVHRTVVHVAALHVNRAPDEPNNRDLRIKYMMDEMTETLFRRALIQKEKAHKKEQEFHAIYATFVNVSDDLLRQLVVDVSKINEIKETFKNLVNYINTELIKVRNRYGSKAAIEIIGPNWDPIQYR